MTGILETPNVPLALAWNTWAADRPLEMSFRPLGLRITPMLFAASTGKAAFLGPGPAIRFGRHEIDASVVEARITHAKTVLDWRYGKTGPYDLDGGWSTAAFGEWGLRFWVVLCLSAEKGGLWHYDEATKTALLTHGPRTLALAAERAPLLVTGHAALADVAEEVEKHGYWYLASRATEAPVLALRFNLEEAPDNRFAVSIADRADLAVTGARRRLSDPQAPAVDHMTADLAAVRDIMGWNTIWDGTNHRPYITCSRNWDIKKFGGFGFWLNDMAVNALLVSAFDPELGRNLLASVLASATPAGNLPCLITGNDAWVDRTQAPLVSFIAWQMFERTRDRTLLEAAYPVLARNNAWLRQARDGNRNGLLEYGSSDAGRGLYVGTKLAAKDESFMDNSPVHDEARWIEACRTLDCEDVGLNALVALDSEMLGRMARALGHSAAAESHERDAEALRRRIQSQLWDGRRQIFCNRLWSGKFVDSLAPTSYFPLLCGAATPEQTTHLLRHIEDPQTFGGALGLPSVARNDAAVADNVYWRGRIWPVLNWLVGHGLRRAGAHDAAARLVDTGRRLFERSWIDGRLAPENYHAATGEGLDQPDTDPFYAWTALLPFMVSEAVAGFSPWSGFTLNPVGADVSSGPFISPFGRLVASRRDGGITLGRDGRRLLAFQSKSTLEGLSVHAGVLRAVLPAAGNQRASLTLSGISRRAIVHATLDDAALAGEDRDSGVDFDLPCSDRPRRLTIVVANDPRTWLSDA